MRLRLRGDVPIAVWLVLLVVVLAEYAWWHSQTRLWDGDAYDYVAMALRYAGNSVDEAIRHTGAFFHLGAPATELLRGPLTGQKGLPGTEAYNLETPRALTPLLAVPFMWEFGPKGVWLMLALSAAGLVLCTRSLYVTLGVGAFVPCVFLTILDATGKTSLRYFVPMYPMPLMLGAQVLRTVLAQVPSTASRERWPHRVSGIMP